MTDHSQQSTSNPCQACTSGRQKVIYLTFDDGPEPGTFDIYDLLIQMDVPATFFMVGENVIAQETGVFATLGLGVSPSSNLFKKIFDNPLFEIGNHSQTQSHQFYQSYYDSGLRIEAATGAPNASSSVTGARRSVLVDFELANVAFSDALAGTPSNYTTNRALVPNQGYRGATVNTEFTGAGVSYFRFLSARMPGTNRWRLSPSSSTRTTRSDTAYDWMRSSADRDDDADDLATNDYRVYGWDLEWEMSNSTSVMSADVNAEHQAGADGWWDGYRLSGNDSDDHLNQSVDDMFSSIQSQLDRTMDGTYFESSADSKCVILMHDRQFRDSNPPGATNPHIEKLRDLITRCQAEGYLFDVVSNY